MSVNKDVFEECWEADEEQYEECEYSYERDGKYYCCPFPDDYEEDPDEREYFENLFIDDEEDDEEWYEEEW